MLTAATVTLASCGQEPKTTIEVNRTLAIWGAPSSIATFLARHPGLKASPTAPMSADRMRMTVTVPAGFSGKDMVRTGREIVDAGLNYSMEVRKIVRTSPSWNIRVGGEPSRT